MSSERTDDPQYDHELMHALQVFETMVERVLFEHPAMQRYPIAKNHVEAAIDALAEAYQEMGRAIVANTEAGDEPEDQ